jgi:biopolymer transport protein ExbD
VPVTILGDANAPHQAVVGAMDAARQLGIASVRIATRNDVGGS